MGLREMFFSKRPPELPADAFDDVIEKETGTPTTPSTDSDNPDEEWAKHIKTPEAGPSRDTKNALRDLKEQLKTSGQEKKPENFPDGSQKIPLIEDPDLLQEDTDEEVELTEADILDVKDGK